MYALRFRGQYPEPVAQEVDAMNSALRAWLTVDHNEDGTHHLRPSGFDFVPIGSIQMWATDTAPAAWLMCDGTAVSRTTYQSLFQVIGTSYGGGDGSNTFNLPDLRQRFPLGKATSGTGATLGSTGGTIDHTHSFSGGNTGSAGGFSTSTSSNGSHSHSQGAHQHAISSVDNVVTGGGGTLPGTATQIDIFNDSGTSTNGDHSHTVSVGDHTHTFGSGGTGAGNPPFVVLNFIILSGVA